MNILLVRLRLIGDVVFTTPLVAALRERHPSAHLAYLVEAPAAQVVRYNPHLSEVITTTHARGWARVREDLRLSRLLARSRYDVVIDLHGGPRSAWLTWASRAGVRLGYDVPGRSWMYTRVVARPRSYRPRHAVENQWDLLAAFDDAIGAPSRARFPVQMWAGSDDVARATTFVTQAQIPPSATIIVMHVSAGNPFRRWAEGSFAEVAAHLASADDSRRVVITAGPSDRDAANRVVLAARSAAPATSSRIVLADDLPLGALRSLLDRAALFVGGDSGPMHVASTSPAAIVAIYGPTLPERSAPWRSDAIGHAAVDGGPLPCRPCDQRTCVPGDFRCLTAITPEAVINAAGRLLAEARP